jgi:hypothetical protein
MERCLERIGVRKEASVKVQHFQETSELADGLGKRARLKVCNPFRERLGTRG